MKLNKYSWLAALPVLFTACQEDTLVKGQQQGKIYALSARMDDGAAMSRAQIQLGNKDVDAGEIFMWNAGDSFDLHQTIDETLTTTTFSINSDYSESGDGDKTTAVFSTTTPATTGSYTAIYPSGHSFDNGYIRCNIANGSKLDFSTKSYDKVWKEYFNTNMHLIATGSLSASKSNALSFSHLTSLIRITYTNKTNSTQVIAGVALGGDQHFRLWNNYNLENGEVAEYGGVTNDYKTYTDGLSVKAGESTDLYIVTFPYDFNDGEMHINIIGESGNYKCAKMPTDILRTNLGSTSFEAQTRYWFQITEIDGGQMIWSKDFGKVIIPNVELSQALLNYLGSDKVSINYNNYAVMTQTDVEAVDTLKFSIDDKIPSLAGIENFVNLKYLKSRSVELEYCDLSQNTQLTYVDVQSNNLTSLNLKNCADLEQLFCQYNTELSEIILTDCKKLSNFQAQETAVKKLDIPNPSVMDNLLLPVYTAVDLNQFTTLTGLGLMNSGLSDLDDVIPDEMKGRLSTLFCNDNSLTTLDLSKYPSLGVLHCQNNRLASLDITSLVDLSSLFCGEQTLEDDAKMKLYLTSEQYAMWESTWTNFSSNVITEIVSQEETITIDNEPLAQVLKNSYSDDVILQDGKAIMTKSFAENKVDGIGIWNNSDVTSLKGIENFPNLKYLTLVNTGLTSLDVSTFEKLEYLKFCENPAISLNVNGCTSLTYLNCEDNKLTSLDLTNCTEGKIDLYCGNQGSTANEEITITIKLTEVMKTYWKSFLYDEGNNKVRVFVDGEKPEIVIPSIEVENW